MTQLDLFAKRESRKHRTKNREEIAVSENVVLFPLHRRTNLVRAVATRLASMRTRKAKQRYWDHLIAGLQRGMRAGGMTEPSIANHMSAFWTAVDRELQPEKYEVSR